MASRIHQYAEESLSLDPSIDQGGAQRLLSRFVVEDKAIRKQALEQLRALGDR